MAAVAAAAGRMIAARPAGPARFAARLTMRARRLAEARLEARAQAARRWRLAHLLWPLFTKEP
jgi:hypothetical protein